MKKFIAIIAAIALIATMSVAAFAADPVTCDTTDFHTDAVAGVHNNTHDVFVDLTGEITNVICVVVEWGDMKFTYDGDMIWDPHTLQYKANGEGVYTPVTAASEGVLASDKFEVTNYSDINVNVTVKFADIGTGVAASDVSIADQTKELNKVAVDKDTNIATAEAATEFTVDPADSAAPTIVEGDEDGTYVKVGTLTVTVEAA